MSLFIYPIGKDWFWNTLDVYQGGAKTAFIGVGAIGTLVLLAGLLPVPEKARNAVTITLGLVGIICLLMV